jgi:SPP1 gp7 family putative phage head morphogenesis protein
LISVHAASVRYDPTRTLHLRNTFARAFRVKFAKLKAAIFRAIVTEDCFGLKPPDPIFRRIMVQETALTTPGHEAFAFPRSQDKVSKFMEWLQAQEQAGLLEVGTRPQLGQAIESAWTDKYITDSYSRGIQRARYELAHAGYGVPSMEATGGVLASMSLPFHMDRVGLLYSRTFSELKGVTSAMDQIISRVLSQSMADGDGARVIARKLLTTISGVGDLSFTDKIGRFIPAEQRAEMIARTETIRAFNEAALQEYRNWGAVGVSAEVEFQTAGDSRVCPRCASLQGKKYTLDEASGVLPLHVRCRCCWLPVDLTGKEAATTASGSNR